MTVTVDTSLDGAAAPAVVPDLQVAIQAAQSYAAQAAAALAQASVILKGCRDAAAGADAAADQAAGAVAIALNNVTIGAAALNAYFTGLPTQPPASTGAVWNDGGLVAISGLGGSGGATDNGLAYLTALFLSLPTTLPAASGKLWLNNGVPSVS